MAACDFFRKNVWASFGKRVAYGLMIIRLCSRKVSVGPSTYYPAGERIQQQARNLRMWLEDQGLTCGHPIYDRDTKYTETFDHFFVTAGTVIARTPFLSPIVNCFAESWIGTLKRESLNHFFCFSLGYLHHIVRAYADRMSVPHIARGL